MVYLDYPFSKPVFRKNSVSFTVFGSEQLSFRLMVIKNKSHSLPAKLKLEGSRQEVPEAFLTKEGHLEYTLSGNQKIRITW